MARGLGATSSDEEFKMKQEETRRTKATGLRAGLKFFGFFLFLFFFFEICDIDLLTK